MRSRPLLPLDQPANVLERLSVRPGLTGWAQVNGGKLVKPEEKGALDLYYVNHASLALDIKIAWMTLLMFIQGDRLNLVAIKQAQVWLAGKNAMAAGLQERLSTAENSKMAKNVYKQAKTATQNT